MPYLLLCYVSRDLNELHPVQEGAGNCVGHVSSSDEEDPREVDGYVQVVVQEVPVLLWVQQLQEGRGGVALVPPAQLVDLINQDKWILCPYLHERGS